MARAGPKIKSKEKTKRLTPEEQFLRFVEAAKEAGADESPNALDKAFGGLNVKNKVITQKPR
jgi:hypothetical protein